MKLEFLGHTYGLLFSTVCIALVSGCVRAKQRSPALSSKNSAFSFEEYASMCSQALGDAPEIDCSATESAGKYVAVLIGDWKKNTLSDVRLTENLDTTSTTGPTEEAPDDHYLGCINDSWIMAGGSWWPRCDSRTVYQKFQSKSRTGDSVIWIAACRVRIFKTNIFQGDGQVGLIGYNEKSGETCFFNSSKVPKNQTIPSANSSGAAAKYDDWARISASVPCVRCHQTAPWIQSPENMPHKLHERFKDLRIAKETKHKGTFDFLNLPFTPPGSWPMIPSNLKIGATDEFGRPNRAAAVPYVVVARERLEKTKWGEDDKESFVPGD